MKTDEKYWADFAENVQMVIGHDQAMDACLKWLQSYGVRSYAIADTSGNKYCSADLVERMMEYYKSTEEYEKCAVLSSLKYIDDKKTPIDKINEFTKFLYNTTTVMSFEDNCQVCWEVFSEDEMIPFYSMDEPQDYVALMMVLVNHFHGRGEFDKVMVLEDLRKEVVHETKSGSKFFKMKKTH